MVDNPELAAAYLAGEVELTEEQMAQYAYETSLMNDVHMSHAMEFPYPQSMSNCVTCHEGKLDTVLADENFTVAICKSCHPVTGASAVDAEEETIYDTTGLALKTILPEAIHSSMDLDTEDCTVCHGEGKAAAGFSAIHTGYDKMIYTAEGVRYSDVISVMVDDAAFDGATLNIEFSATASEELEGIDLANMTPTVMVGLYGWDTKDYIIGPHERLFDDNEDGVLDRSDLRTLEYVIGEEHPRFSTVSAEDGSWAAAADLSFWTDMIEDGTVKRVEIAVIPTLEDADGMIIALDAPSRTFDLGANAFDDEFYSPIVKMPTVVRPATMRWRRTTTRPIEAGTSSSAGCATSPRVAAPTWRCSQGQSIPTCMRSMPASHSTSVTSTSPSQWLPCTMSITSSSRIPPMAPRTVHRATSRAPTTCRIRPCRCLACSQDPTRSRPATGTSVRCWNTSLAPPHGPVGDATRWNTSTRTRPTGW